MLCSILGLDIHLVAQLQNLSEVHRNHQNDEYWIKHFISEKFSGERIPYKRDTVCKELQAYGFTDTGANRIAEWLCNRVTMRQQQPLNYWVDRYIDRVVKYSSDTVELPSASLEKDNASGNDTWFHATDHKSARHILTNGIQCGKGNYFQDFGPGFYLTQSYSYAVDWMEGHAPYGAILVFEISPEQMKRFSGLNLQRDDEKWKDLVKYNRLGQDISLHKPEKELKKLFKKVDYVIGPMVGNGMCCNTRWVPEKIGSTDQMCIKTQNMACVVSQSNSIRSKICTP